MKFLRLGDAGQETPAVLDEQCVARDVSSIVPDFNPDTIDGLARRIAAVDLSTLPILAIKNIRVAAPMAQPCNLYCIGLNYSDYAAEAGMGHPRRAHIIQQGFGHLLRSQRPDSLQP